MNSTREQLLSTAEGLVRSRGYAGFSFADLTEEAGIRKPSIHHHFPTKEDLGVALVDEYTDRFDARLLDIENTTLNALSQLTAYADLYLEGLRDDRACLCAMLASDHALTPKRVQIGVAAFFEANRSWLESVIVSGQRAGVIDRGSDPADEARAFHAAVVGAMFAARTSGRIADFEFVTQTCLKRLKARQA